MIMIQISLLWVGDSGITSLHKVVIKIIWAEIKNSQPLILGDDVIYLSFINPDSEFNHIE